MTHNYPHRLILVEGLTGSGKSTMAHFIARQLQANHIPARWIHEGEMVHPYLIDVDTTIEHYMVDTRARLTAFAAQTAQSPEVVVVEAGLFNNLIERVFMYNVERSRVGAYGLELLAIIEGLNPALVYLDPGEVEAALVRNFQNRGEGFRDFVIDFCVNTLYAKTHQLTGYDGMVAFWQAFVSITDEMFEQWTYTKTSVPVAARDWDRHNQQVLDSLAIPYRPDPVLPSERAGQLIGTYTDAGQDRTFTVTVQADQLMIDITGVPTALIPAGDDVFAIAGWHFIARFVADDAGKIVQVIIEGADIDYMALVGTCAERVS